MDASLKRSGVKASPGPMRRKTSIASLGRPNDSRSFIAVHQRRQSGYHGGFGLRRKRTQRAAYFAGTKAAISRRYHNTLYVIMGPDVQQRGQHFPPQRQRSAVIALGNQPVQFERVGYFVCDSKDSQPASQVFNRIVSLRQSQDRKRQENKAAFRQGIQQTTGG